MKTAACFIPIILGVIICIGAGAMALRNAMIDPCAAITPVVGVLMTAGTCFTLAGVLALFMVEPEVWL